MVVIRTWNENITTVQMPTQLCREKSSGMWKPLFKSNTGHRPKMDRSRAKSISPACTTFQVCFSCLGTGHDTQQLLQTEINGDVSYQ